METKLIESALWLTGKTMEDFGKWNDKALNSFFILDTPKFCYYLLSPEFIEKYIENWEWEVYPRGFDESEFLLRNDIAKWIYWYQKWAEQPLIYLLSKIK